jgi:thiamine kinase-like enzyme
MKPIEVSNWFSFHSRFALPRVSLIHGDPNVGNFMRTHTGALRLLDWEMSGSNHRLMDVAAFITSNELTKEVCGYV